MPGPLIDRRHFLGSAAATAAFFAMHDVPALGFQGGAAVPAHAGRPRILSLELLSGAPFGAMKTFYGKTLDLRIMDEKEDRFTVEAGETRLTFVKPSTAPGVRPPFYHFAFNIPENKIVKALEWQKARTPLLAIPERNQAAGYPPGIVAYNHWNAHSVFFLDPAGNVVEYIARHDLKNGDSAAFSWADILYASEIALVVDDVPATAAKLTEVAAVAPYKSSDDQFAAMGDEYGLLLIMKRGRVIDFTADPSHGVTVFRTTVTIRGAKTSTYQLPDYPYLVGLEERCSCA